MAAVLKLGVRRPITMNVFSGTGAITSVKKVEGGFSCWVSVDEMDGREYEIFFPDDAVTDVRTAYRQSRSGMPLAHAFHCGRDFLWERYPEDTTAQEQISSAFVMDFPAYRREGRGLYIFSKTRGAGKTMLACVLANEILKRHDVGVKFISVPDYLELVKSRSDMDKERIQAMRDVSLLILDDIGAEDGKQPWIEEALFRLVDFRYARHFPTIYTSNIALDEFKARSDRIFSRIYETCTPAIALPEISIREENADLHSRKFLEKIMSSGETGTIWGTAPHENPTV